jgi:hypothetical protein
VLDGWVFVVFIAIFFLYFFQAKYKEGGGNATFIGCQPPLNLIEEEEMEEAEGSFEAESTSSTVSE